MALSINTNVMSLAAQRNLNRTQGGLQTSIERLSSGLRVNSSKDDAAGLAIASRIDAQVRGLNVAVRNAGDAISLAQTAEGGLNEITNMLQRMRELAVQSANATNSTSDRANLNAEFQALNTEITRQIGATKFNGIAVLSAATTQTFQVGANATDTIAVTTSAVSAAPGGDITSAANATTALGTVDTALDTVTTTRATYGAVQNRFESVINNLTVASENQAAARSRIMDADFAMETANLTRLQILQQAGTAMVAQANQVPQSVLSLLQ
ncbi:MAG: flagellin [Gammaproteobacteria bacterium]|nr:flagellin [Gammaproteobacteria bacterium]MDH5514712.1 flagellin [Gammaproteobacteria bacterium]